MLFVFWEREDDPRNRNDTQIGAAGVVLWRQERSGDGGLRWRSVYQRRYPVWANVNVEVADITGDGVPEVLHFSEQGSGGCGAHYVVTTVGRRAREIFRRNSCESDFMIRGRAFVVDEPVGRCPVQEASAHCSGGRRTVTMRWTGTRLVPASSTVECDWPELNLDPARNCERRKA